MKPENSHIKGHSFVYYNRPTYCDNCEDFMWTLSKPCAVRCKKCKYACHECCMASTTFECPKKRVKVKTTEPPSPLPFTPYRASNVKNTAQFKNNEKLFKGAVVGRKDQSSESSRASVVNEKLSEKASLDETTSTQGRDSTCSTLVGSPPNEFLTKQLAMAYPYKYSSKEIFQHVFAYNRGSSGLALTMCQGSTNFRGFIRIKINLTRPVNVKGDCEDMSIRRALSNSPLKSSSDPSGYINSLSAHYCNVIVDVPIDEKENENEEKSASRKSSGSLSPSMNKRWVKQTFHIPKDTTTALHVRSDTTSKEIIVMLLKKYSILGNPNKYSLYVQRKNPENLANTMSTAEIPDEACPLMLLLEWGPLDSIHSISFSEKILKDNIYEHFSVPELMNFHKIITSEKTKTISKIDAKFTEYERILNDVLNNQP